MYWYISSIQPVYYRVCVYSNITRMLQVCTRMLLLRTRLMLLVCTRGVLVTLLS